MARYSKKYKENVSKEKLSNKRNKTGLTFDPDPKVNKTPKVVSVGCVGLWKNNGVLSEFGKINRKDVSCYEHR